MATDLSNPNRVCEWFPSRLLSPSPSSSSSLSPRRNSSSSDGKMTTRGKNPYALLILNQPINIPALKVLLPAAKLVICADGGGDRYLSFLRAEPSSFSSSSSSELRTESNRPADTRADTDPVTEHDTEREWHLPDAVVGDLDSLTHEARAWYTQRGVRIVHDPDQYSTDFTKCLKLIRRFRCPVLTEQSTHPTGGPFGAPVEEEEIAVTHEWSETVGLDVVVMGSLAGRVDQGLSQIHHLYMACDHDHDTSHELLENPRNRIYLLSESSLSFVLDAGVNYVHIDDWPGPFHTSNTVVDQEGGSAPEETKTEEGGDAAPSTLAKDDAKESVFTEKVGIIPVAGPSEITIQGFEWDVQEWSTQLGGQVSTSNHIRSRKLVIHVKPTRSHPDDEVKKCLFTLELNDSLKGSYYK